MIWNYRVVERHVDSTTMLEIREVYYTDAGQPYAFSAAEQSPYGETWDELVADLSHFIKALAQPILQMEELERQCAETARE